MREMKVRNQEIRAMRSAGHPLKVVAEAFGLNVSQVSRIAGGIGPRRGPKKGRIEFALNFHESEVLSDQALIREVTTEALVAHIIKTIIKDDLWLAVIEDDKVAV